MEFRIKEWRRIYDRVQGMGKMIKDSYPYIDENNEYHPAVNELSNDTRKSLSVEIKRLTSQSSNYLDMCGIKPSPALWVYDVSDATTWPSDERFKYKQLLRTI